MSTDPILVVAAGGFDPIHRGHIEYLQHARTLGDRLIVALASDQALIKKKNIRLLSWEDRAAIIRNLKSVDDVICVDDYYEHYASALANLRKIYPSIDIIFACGSSVTERNTPNLNDSKVKFIYNVGGERLNSSSKILREFAMLHYNIQEIEAGPNGRYK